MSKRTLGLDEALHDYLLSVSLRETPLQRALREETDGLERAAMRTAAEQAQFLALMIRILGARRVVEVGTFTGYGTLTMALALPPEGRIVACDTSEQWTSIARRYWAEAGVADRIDLRLAPALDTLEDLLASGASDTFDFAYIDADKINMSAYFEQCMRLVRPGGVIAVDNVLWGGSVADPADLSEDTSAIRAFNDKRRDDPRIEFSLLPIGDGLTIARRR
ncbi:MAG: class I SAM-dependent methyltransferase [Gammaproteobacteria bacterium]|jgi:predicted O-methyltransferase YrrM|nr:class I SAM-dependent methyltransferase [Gammaproteobacteria bacterium]